MRFNKGKCTAGLSCKYDHRCLECGKFGHGEHICRNKKSGQQKLSDKTSQGAPSQTNVGQSGASSNK